jgi:hypothetical protein
MCGWWILGSEDKGMRGLEDGRIKGREDLRTRGRWIETLIAKLTFTTYVISIISLGLEFEHWTRVNTCL